MFGLFFCLFVFCPMRLTNCCCPPSRSSPLHCLGICAQPYQRFNTYCFKLHQSLPLLPSYSPSSPGSFFSVSFYYFSSSSFSPLTSLHIILTLVAFSSASFLPPLLPNLLCPLFVSFFPLLSFSPHFWPALLLLSFFRSMVLFSLCFLFSPLFSYLLIFLFFFSLFKKLS